MPELVRKGSGVWSGDLKGGKGVVSSGSGAIQNAPYSFASRFENAPATNPEELVAAAHAGCFSMALANILAGDGHTPTEIRTTATVRMSLGEGGPRVTSVHLETVGTVPGIDQTAFQTAAEKAKDNCPISKLLKPGLDSLTFDATLGG